MIHAQALFGTILICMSLPLFAGLPSKEKALLKELVEMNSSSDNVEGLERVRARLVTEFENLGLKKKVIEVGKGHKVLSFDHPEGKPQIALIGHIDTVFPDNSDFKTFTEEGKTLKGPGINDMKGGIVLMLMALNELKGTDYIKSVRVILNDDEEIGSIHSASTLKDLVRGLSYGLVYEPTLLSANHVSTTQAGAKWIELKVKGLAAHAGAEHAKGINACVELSHKIIEISKLTSYEKNLTLNPGVIQGGTEPNVVCEEASVKIDLRYVEEKDMNEVMKKIETIAKKSYLKRETKSTVTDLFHIPSLTRQSTELLFEKAKTVAKELGFTLKKEHIGGASDANQLASTGIKLLSGLGPWGRGPHSIHETMDGESFELRKNLSVGLIKELYKKY